MPKLLLRWSNEKTSHVDDEICMSHPELSFPDLRSLKMYRSIWKGFFFLSSFSSVVYQHVFVCLNIHTAFI